MKIGVFYHHVECAAKEKGLSMEEMLHWVKEQGIDYVELDSTAIEDAEKLSGLLSKAGIGVSSICRFYDWNKDASDFHDFIQIRQAKALNCSKIMVIPGLYTSEDEEIRKEENQKILSAMEVFCEKAAAEGLTVTIEDFDNHQSPIATIEGMKWFLDRVPQLMVTLDTGNFYYSGEDVMDAKEVFSDRIVHVHCKDVLPPKVPTEERVMTPCAVGAGFISLKPCIRALEQRGYDGVYSIEHFGTADYFKAIEESAKWLKGVL